MAAVSISRTIIIGKNQLKIHLRPINYVDLKGLVDKIPEGYNWTMHRRIYLKGAEDRLHCRDRRAVLKNVL